MTPELWNVAIVTYISLAVLTFIPTLLAILEKVKLHPGGTSFDTSPHFNEEQKLRLSQHYSRILGTLGFWKNQAAKFKRFHLYTLCWSIPSSVLVPILAQSISDTNNSKLFLTIVSSFTAILFSFHKALKIEDNHKSYRHGESEIFDLYRRLLDRPKSFGNTPEQQIEKYFTDVETIRRYVRNAETDNLATLEEAKPKLQSLDSKD